MKKLKLICLILVIIFLTSCKTTKTVYVPVDKIKTEYVVNNDSIYIHDSIYLYVHTKNDTIIINKYVEHIREIYKTDTLCRIDSIPVLKEIEKIIITNELCLWLKILIWIGFICILWFVYKIIRILYIK